MMINPSQFQGKVYENYGSDQLASMRYIRTLLQNYAMQITPNEDIYHSEALPVALEPGKIYHLTIDHVEVTSGITDGFSVLLLEHKAWKVVSRFAFDFQYGNRNGGLEYFFSIPEGSGENTDFKFHLYAGLDGETQNIGLSFSGISLSEFDSLIRKTIRK